MAPGRWNFCADRPFAKSFPIEPSSQPARFVKALGTGISDPASIYPILTPRSLHNGVPKLQKAPRPPPPPPAALREPRRTEEPPQSNPQGPARDSGAAPAAAAATAAAAGE